MDISGPELRPAMGYTHCQHSLGQKSGSAMRRGMAHYRQ